MIKIFFNSAKLFSDICLTLSDEILNQINLEVSEFQKAFKDQGAEGLIAQSIRDTIRPVLEEWLKTNLPIIVKEVVVDF